MLSQGAGALFHSEISLSETTGHVGIADALGSGDEPGDEADPTPTTGQPGPPFHAAVQGSSHVASVGQRAASDKLGEGGLDVEATGIGFSESRQERTMTSPGSHSSEILVTQPRAGEQAVPALCLGGTGQRQVFG
jgi:hypothetical protein